MKNEILLSLSKEELIRLIEDYSKNWLAMDGVWFQSVERTRGMDEAMHHDAEAWRRFTVIEAKRIKAFLRQPERGGHYHRRGKENVGLSYSRVPCAAGARTQRDAFPPVQARGRDRVCRFRPHHR